MKKLTLGGNKGYNSSYQTTIGKCIQWESGVQNRKGESYIEKI